MNFFAFDKFTISLPYSGIIFIENTVVYHTPRIIIINILKPFLFGLRQSGKCLRQISHLFRTLIQLTSKSITNKLSLPDYYAKPALCQIPDSQCQFFCTKNEILRGMQ